MAEHISNVSDFPGQQRQKQPGLQHEMNPPPISYDMVGPEGHLEPYKAAGKLKGKKALITGGDSGIGRAVAILFSKEGVDGITILYHPREDKDAADTKKEVESSGSCKVDLIPLDIGDQDKVKQAVDQHVKNFGVIDILVNNAAEQHVCEHIKDIDLDTVRRTFTTNSE